jgi:hypothetical protein
MSLDSGRSFARFAICLAKSRGNLAAAEKIAHDDYPGDARLHSAVNDAVLGPSDPWDRFKAKFPLDVKFHFSRKEKP